MATAFPAQLYEMVSEEEALSRNARQYPQPYVQPYPQPGYSGGYPVGYGQPVVQPVVPVTGRCEVRCQWSYFQGREICDRHCTRL